MPGPPHDTRMRSPAVARASRRAGGVVSRAGISADRTSCKASTCPSLRAPAARPLASHYEL